MRWLPWYHCCIRSFLVLVLCACTLLTLVPSSSVTAEEEGVVKLTIRNRAYEFQGGVLRPDQPAMIILENRDDIEHGFASSLFEEHPVQIEAGGVVTFGNSVKTVHIGSGKTVRIHFQPNRPGRFRFQCDIHPDMKGELLLLSVGTI